MARRQRRFCTSSSPLACCAESSSQASTSGRELSSSFSFSLVGPGAAERRARPLVFASTALKAQASADTVAPKAAPSGDKPIHDVLAGALARAISQGTIHPIDTLKVRMQAASRVVASGGAASAAASAAATHHLPLGPQQPLARMAAAMQSALTDAKSLYRGVLGAAGGAGIIIGAFFAFYSTSKRLLREKTDLPDGTVAFVAGAIAAVGSSVVKVPIAVCIRSVQAGVYPNALAAATSVVQKAGPAGLFTGFLPTLLEDVPDMAVKFAVYETLRAVHMQLHHQERPSTLEDLLMGGVAGSAAAAATTPLDVVKTRMMCSASERPTVMQAARGILAERPGLGSFFRGVGPRALSNGLNSAIFYMWFELLRAKIREVLDSRQQQRQQLAAGQAIPALLVGQGASPPSSPSLQHNAAGQEGQQAQQAPSHVATATGAAPRSGSGHQAVASCSLRALARPTGADAVGAGETAAGPSSSGTLGVDGGGGGGGVHAGHAGVGADGSVALRAGASGGGGALRSAGPSTSASDRIACLSLAVPLLDAGKGGLWWRSG
ncbi:hypothetical protein PLESTB_000702100 [Pleodorina starrii]|uniref:Uncharacterized protein n=1 Tax=Pleodorina starrii TaxID=330485 RepID=A0A9W6BJP9_9CHLO|nr:hypothetical protein PLESTB_000702100 [Pleodorina starrii]GLC75008.1 hypothetical protein PLESTF_001583000 [Pleodorina starrii]